jgi:imidazolonepropionase-like amidohydrolase
MGAWQMRSRDQVTRAMALNRDMQRADTILIRGARILTGDGKTVESGGVLVKKGKVEAVYEGATPDPAALRAEVVEGAGKTLLPGFIDTHVHLGAPGGIAESAEAYNPEVNLPRELAAYLYSGVAAVRSVGDPLDALLRARGAIASGRRVGAELFLCGPMFTAPEGHGVEFVRRAPEFVRPMLAAQLVRTPKSADEARAQVRELHKAGVDGIKIILESGWGGMRFERLDTAIARAAAEEARSLKLPVAVHTGDARDAGDAVDIGASVIEHGSAREALPDALLARMAAGNVMYSPTLSVLESYRDVGLGKTDLLNRSLTQQVGPAALMASTKKLLKPGGAIVSDEMLRLAKSNLARAWRAGVPLAAGTDSGNLLLVHGPAVHRELQLWVEAGVPAGVALEAATGSAAKLLRAEGRLGCIAKGCDASLLLVDGNPLQDIASTERISLVIYKGERLRRGGLLDQK